MRTKPCPRCGTPEGLINCRACTDEYAGGPSAIPVRSPVDLTPLARNLANAVDDETWRNLGTRKQVEWRERGREFVADCAAAPA